MNNSNLKQSYPRKLVVEVSDIFQKKSSKFGKTFRVKMNSDSLALTVLEFVALSF